MPVVVQPLGRVWIFVTLWPVAREASLSFTISPSLPESVMLSHHLSAALFFFCLLSFPASGSFPMSRLFTSSGPRIGASAPSLVLPMNIQGWFPLGWTGWISLYSKGLSRVFSNTTVQKHQFFNTQPSSQFNSHIHTWPLEKPYPWLDGPLLAK